MKKIFALLVFVFAAIYAMAQPTVRTKPTGWQFMQQGSSTTWTQNNGIVYPVVGFAPPLYADTTAANATDLDQVALCFISTSSDGKWWRRNMALTKWEEVTFGGLNTYTFTNGITNSAGTVKLGGGLSENTTVTAGAFSFRVANGNIQLDSTLIVGEPDESPILSSVVGINSNDNRNYFLRMWDTDNNVTRFSFAHRGNIITGSGTIYDASNHTLQSSTGSFSVRVITPIVSNTQGANDLLQLAPGTSDGRVGIGVNAAGDNLTDKLQLKGGFYGDFTGKRAKFFGIVPGEMDSVYGPGASGDMVTRSIADIFTEYGGGGGGGSSSINLNSKKALYFPGGTTESHVLHGYYFVEDFEFGDGLFEAWIKPESGGYVIADGYGGVHVWLLGVADVNDSMFVLSGNSWYGGVSTGLLSKDYIKKNTRHHIAVGLSGGYYVTYIDGVPSWKVACSTGRKNWAAAGAGQLFIGGSDHQNFKGVIYNSRLWEDKNPFSIDGPTYVQQAFRADEPYVSFAADYTNWQNSTFEDHSAGLFGVKHPGVIHHSQAVYSPAPIVSTDSLPHFIADSIFKSPYVGAITSNPSGCKIFDAFERTDEVPAFDLPNIDTTQSGTLGRKPYTFGNGGWSSGIYAGIINTYCYFSYLGGGNNFVTVTGDSGDQDVRVTSSTTASEQKVIAIARYTDENNRIYASQEGGSVQLYKFVGGSFTALGGYSGSSFSELRLVVSGSNATVYCDGVSRITSSSVGDVPSTGHGSGFGSSSSFTRIKKFEVY